MPRTSHTTPHLCLHFITFGISRGSPTIPMPVICHLDLTTARTPPRHLLDAYTGASSVLARSFFSLPGHESHYQDTLIMLEDRLWRRLADPRARTGICVAVLVNCRAGMHRSVAMAERLARDVRRWRWDGVCVVVEHLDTDVERGVRRARRAETVGGRGWGSGGFYAGGYGGRCRCYG